MTRLGIIGWGSIGQGVGDEIVEGSIPGVELTSVLRASGMPVGENNIVGVAKDITTFLDTKPDLVLEAAGREAAIEYALPIIKAGVPLIIMSISALTDDGYRSSLIEAAKKSGARILVPSGGLAGIDGLSAGYFGGLERVVITQRKPPKAILPPEDAANCDAPRQINQLSAREAGVEFPKNANISVGAGLSVRALDNTIVRIFADPNVTRNVAEVDATGEFGKLTLRIENEPTPNLRTAKTAIYSALAAIDRFTQPLVLGA